MHGIEPNGRTAARLVAAFVASAGLAACASSGGHSGPAQYRTANLRPYDVAGQHYQPRVIKKYEEAGVASWYSYAAHPRRTATGEWYDPGEMTAAHKTLPLPCFVEVTNLANGRKIKVRVNDRGPFVSGRIIDLSRAAADKLGYSRQGTARVKVKFLGPAPQADSGQILLAEVNDAQPDAAPAS